MTLRPFLPTSAVLFLLLLTGLVINAPAMAKVTYHKLSLVNQTSAKVNCQTVLLNVDHGNGSWSQGNRGPKSWAPGETHSFRLGTHSVCKGFSVKLECISMSDGWQRTFAPTSTQCGDINGSFQIDQDGELVFR